MSISASASLFREFNYNKVFVETGTYKCGGIKAALQAGFKMVHSIEADQGYYTRARDRYKGHTGVRIWHGDSSAILWEVIKDINQPITFWLDSHWFEKSKPEKTKSAPLLDELAAIAKHPIKTHTILIDDRRLIGSVDPSCPGWAELTDWLRQANLVEYGHVSVEVAPEPAMAIAYASNRYDAVALGTPPLYALQRRLLGSLAEQVIVEAHCSTLVMRTRDVG